MSATVRMRVRAGRRWARARARAASGRSWAYAGVALIVALGVTVVAARGRAAPAPDTVAIVGATVFRGPGDKLEGATVVIRAGAIMAVGVGVKVPAEARVIDAKGAVVTAGFIDSATSMGLLEIDLEASFNDGEPTGGADQVHAAYRVVDGYDPRSVAIPVARAGGVTSVVVLPGGSGLIGGQAAWMSLTDGGRAADQILAAPAAMSLRLGNAGRKAADGSRGMTFERARELLEDARVYATRKGAYEKNQSRELAASRLDLDALGPVIQGKVPLVVEVDRASDIARLLALAKELKLKVIIVGGAEAWLEAEALAAAKVPVILNAMNNLPANAESLRARDDGAAILARAGVAVMLSPLRAPSAVRTLRQVAGVAVAYGLTWDQALAAVTTTPAAVFGQPARGTVTVGAPADLVVWSGDPFELATRPLHVFVAGVEASLRTRQTLLLERYRRLGPGAPAPSPR
jgi:imidazolonepropionase-like amidohydrolase